VTALSNLAGRLYSALATFAAVLLLLLMLIICADVFLRNVALFPTLRGFPATNDLSEAFLYLITLLSAPWLLRQGQHIRVDILLKAIPPHAAWCCEWVADVLGLMCSLVVVWYGASVTWDAYASGEFLVKAMATPMWWWLVVLPLVFLLLAFEFVFRMHRLAHSEKGPREETVSAA